MHRPLKLELRHNKILLKYSYRNAKNTPTGDLRDLFLAQCLRLEQKIDLLKKSIRDKK